MEQKQKLKDSAPVEKWGKNQKRIPAGESEASQKAPEKEPPMIGIRPRKRGGQPDNQNAAKRGWYTKESRELRARVKDLKKRANAMIAWAEEKHGLKRKRGRPRKCA